MIDRATGRPRSAGRGLAGASDDELVARARDGDHRAFGQLVRRHDGSMRRLVGRMVDNPVVTDDVLQEAYLKGYRGLGSFDGRAQFSTWLYSVTYRTCLDHLRARGRRPQAAVDELDHDLAEDPGPAIEDLVTSRTQLRSALSALPPDQAAVVLLIDGEGHGYDSVAEILGVASGTVASRLSRARAALRQTIQAASEGGDR